MWVCAEDFCPQGSTGLSNLDLQGSTAVKPGTFVLVVHGTHELHPPIFAAVFPFAIIPFPWLNTSPMHKLS